MAKSPKLPQITPATPEPVVICPVDGNAVPITQGACLVCGTPISAKVEARAAK